MNQLDKDYQNLLLDIMANGVEKGDRTGTGTVSVFGRQIRHDMQYGFPLLTTKKMAIKSIMTELKWFLKGDTNIKYLVENGCNIWNGDAYKRYKEDKGTLAMGPESFIQKIKTQDHFAEKWGELGPIYGKQWRSWKINLIDPNTMEFVPPIDQIKNLIEEIKNNPNSRRLMVSAWNVAEMDGMVLPPCHYGFQVYTRDSTREEKIVNPGKYKVISLMWNQRSVDTFLGLPFNIASYATLLQLIADEVNMVPEDLIGNLGDVHLYNKHIEQAEEIITREPYKLPKLEITNCDIMNGEFDYKVINYESHPTIKAPLSN